MASVYVLGNQAQSTCASPITNAQTTVTLASTAAFTVPGSAPSAQQYIVRIDDTANPAWTQATGPYEFAMVTANNTGTATLTWTRGQEGTSGTAFSTGATVTQVLTAGTLKGGMPIKLGEALGTGASGTVTFASIPSTYRTLQIIYSARDTTVTNGLAIMTLQFNGDAGANYYSVHVWSTGAGFNNATTTGVTSGQAGAYAQGGTGAGNSGEGVIWIPNYAGTNFVKHWRTTASAAPAGNAPGQWDDIAGQWNSTVAINQVALLTAGGSWTTTSLFTLYGLP